MASSSDAAILVLTTFPDEERARTAVEALVEQRVVACGTVIPGVTSVYRWQGTVETASEVQVILKTRADRAHDVQHAIAAQHPYDVPEILVLDVSGGSEAYLSWIAAEVRKATEDAE
jgi:periplasmic divalent cation tolerance protein